MAMLAMKVDGAHRFRRFRPGRMQAAHRLSISAQHRDGKRGLATHVLRLEVGAQLDKEIQDVVALSVQGEMQRRLPVFEARHAAVERLADSAPPLLE